MKAIILAAGEGQRLRPYTIDRPKCLVELGGKALLLHQVETLRAAGIADITVVTGYRADRIESLGFPTRHNPGYANTNMVASLMCAADLLDGGDDLVISYSDIVYEETIVKRLCECQAPLSITVDRDWLRLWRLRMADPLSDAETLKLNDAEDVVELGKRPTSYADIQGQYMGIIGVRRKSVPLVRSAYRQLAPDRLYDGRPPERMFMTTFLQHMIDHGQPVRAVVAQGGWLEIDTVEELDRYNRMYADGSLDSYCRLQGDLRPAR